MYGLDLNTGGVVSSSGIASSAGAYCGVCTGSPVKVVRQLSDEQIEGLKASANHYVNNQQWFSEALQELIDDDETDPRTKL